jgi:hypothetical protein
MCLQLPHTLLVLTAGTSVSPHVGNGQASSHIPVELSSCTRKNDVLNDGTAAYTTPDPDPDQAFHEGLKKTSSPAATLDPIKLRGENRVRPDHRRKHASEPLE